MRTRTLLGALLLLFVGGLFAVDAACKVRVAIPALVCLAGIAGWCELSAIAGLGSPSRGGSPLLFAVGLLGTAYFLIAGWWVGSQGKEEAGLLSAGLAAGVFAAFASVVFRADPREQFVPLLLTILGPILCGFFLSYLTRIYLREDGIWLGAAFLLGIKGNDIAAYYTGRLVGRTHFLPVSPKKTLEGSLGAVAFSAAWFAAVAALRPTMVFPWPWGILVGIILSIASQVGDISESLIKRYYQVKDSGVLLPEFGGVLDLLDSFTFCGYLFWLFLTAF